MRHLFKISLFLNLLCQWSCGSRDEHNEPPLFQGQWIATKGSQHNDSSLKLAAPQTYLVCISQEALQIYDLTGQQPLLLGQRAKYRLENNQLSIHSRKEGLDLKTRITNLRKDTMSWTSISSSHKSVLPFQKLHFKKISFEEAFALYSKIPKPQPVSDQPQLQQEKPLRGIWLLDSMQVGDQQYRPDERLPSGKILCLFPIAYEFTEDGQRIEYKGSKADIHDNSAASDFEIIEHTEKSLTTSILASTRLDREVSKEHYRPIDINDAQELFWSNPSFNEFHPLEDSIKPAQLQGFWISDSYTRYGRTYFYGDRHDDHTYIPITGSVVFQFTQSSAQCFYKDNYGFHTCFSKVQNFSSAGRILQFESQTVFLKSADLSNLGEEIALNPFFLNGSGLEKINLRRASQQDAERAIGQNPNYRN